MFFAKIMLGKTRNVTGKQTNDAVAEVPDENFYLLTFDLS